MTCPENWSTKAANAVDLNFNINRATVPAAGVDFNFACVAPCPNFWTDYYGNQVPIPFNTEWTDYLGNQVPIAFECGEVPGPEYTLFTGFFDAGAGETYSLDVATSYRVEFLDGAVTEVTDLFLPERNFSVPIYDGAEFAFSGLETQIYFAPNFYDGAVIPAGGCGTPTAGFENVGSSENNGTITSTGFRLKNPGNGNSGSLVATDAITIGTLDTIEFAWTQSLSGAWYDNDDSDASVNFGLFFDREIDTITSLPLTWEYDSPFDGYSVGTNYPWIRFWLPRDSAAKSITPLYRLADGSIQSFSAFTKAAGVDLYANAEIRFKLVKESDKVRLEFYVNDVLINSYLTLQPWPTKVAPLWYYRNYNNPTSYVDISNVEVCQGFDLLTTYPPHAMSMPMDYYDGAEVTTDLATTTTVEFDFYSGEELSTVLNTSPPIDITINGYDGAEAAVTLWTLSSFAPPVYDGAYTDAVLTTNPASTFVIDIRDGGEGVLSDLSTAIQLGTVALYEGGRLDGVLDTLENWYFYEGPSVELALATDTTLAPLAYAGEEFTLGFSTFPSEGMGTFSAYDGARVDYSLVTLVQVLLYPNEIKDPHAFNYDVLGFMGIDLNNGTCCPVKDDHTRIELTAGPAPDEYYHGDKVVVQVDLSTLPRFSMSMYEGANFRGIDPEYMTLNFYEGSASFISSVHFDEYNFNLCKGNFIPDGDNINVELVSVDTSNCESLVAFGGESVKLDIEANTNFQVPLPEGARMEFDIFIEPIMRLNIYAGEYVRVSNPEFSPFFYEGPYTNFVFEEKDIVGYGGEFMELSSLTTNYDVEFLEQGCLDNEFVPANENGDPDMERFNPVPVELDFFSHSIKAHCF